MVRPLIFALIDKYPIGQSFADSITIEINKIKILFYTNEKLGCLKLIQRADISLKLFQTLLSARGFLVNSRQAKSWSEFPHWHAPMLLS